MKHRQHLKVILRKMVWSISFFGLTVTDATPQSSPLEISDNFLLEDWHQQTMIYYYICVIVYFPKHK
jgi:hypothetical protein